MKLTKFAGFYEARRVLSLCEAFGLGYRYDGMSQTRVAATAALHLTLAHSKGIPSGGSAFLRLEKDLVAEGGVKVEAGMAKLVDPRAPGLGIAMNPELLGSPDTYS